MCQVVNNLIEQSIYIYIYLVLFNLALGVILEIAVPLEPSFYDLSKLLRKRVVVVEEVVDAQA